MVTTRSSNGLADQGEHPSEFSSDPLAVITEKLSSLDEIFARLSALEAASRGKKRPIDEGRRRSHWEEDSEDDYDRRGLRPPYTKIEFPKFSGGDPRGWILKAEKFFRYYQTPEDLKVDVASMSLEGDALDLFSWVNSDRTLLYWDELVKTLQEHYGPPEYQNPDEHLAAVKQTGTVQGYRQEFAKRVARVRNWPEHCLLGVFLGGLKEELKADVRIQKPRTVYKAASLALEFEKKAQTSCGPRPNSYTPSRVHLSPHAHDFRDSTKPNSSTSIAPKYSATKTSSEDVERQIRRDKGLCFRCGAPFRPGHRCNASFSLLEISEEGEEVIPPIKEEAETKTESENAEISFNAILGQHSSATMKLQGTVKGRSVLILIDSGSTHNFISESVLAESVAKCTKNWRNHLKSHTCSKWFVSSIMNVIKL